jgi:hypothetical protein
MSSLLPTHLNKMVLWRGRIELYWIWQGPCLMNTRLRTGFGLRRLTPPSTPSTDSTFTESSRRHLMNSSLVKSPMFHILESLELDDEEALYVALRNMSIGDVCPKESEEPTQAQDQPSSSNQASPPTQDEDEAQNDENEDQEDEPSQEEDNDQGGDDNDKDKEDNQEIQGQRTPHLRVHQAIQ